MKPPLKLKHINAIHAHQFICDYDKTLVPYLCPNDNQKLLAKEEGLTCPICGYFTEKITYWGKMNTTGKIIPEVFD
jgi:hypothetical protein